MISIPAYLEQESALWQEKHDHVAAKVTELTTEIGRLTEQDAAKDAARSRERENEQRERAEMEARWSEERQIWKLEQTALEERLDRFENDGEDLRDELERSKRDHSLREAEWNNRLLVIEQEKEALLSLNNENVLEIDELKLRLSVEEEEKTRLHGILEETRCKLDRLSAEFERETSEMAAERREHTKRKEKQEKISTPHRTVADLATHKARSTEDSTLIATDNSSSSVRPLDRHVSQHNDIVESYMSEGSHSPSDIARVSQTLLHEARVEKKERASIAAAEREMQHPVHHHEPSLRHEAVFNQVEIATKQEVMDGLMACASVNSQSSTTANSNVPPYAAPDLSATITTAAGAAPLPAANNRSTRISSEQRLPSSADTAAAPTSPPPLSAHADEAAAPALSPPHRHNRHLTTAPNQSAQRSRGSAIPALKNSKKKASVAPAPSDDMIQNTLIVPNSVGMSPAATERTPRHSARASAHSSAQESPCDAELDVADWQQRAVQEDGGARVQVDVAAWSHIGKDTEWGGAWSTRQTVGGRASAEDDEDGRDCDREDSGESASWFGGRVTGSDMDLFDYLDVGMDAAVLRGVQMTLVDDAQSQTVDAVAFNLRQSRNNLTETPNTNELAYEEQHDLKRRRTQDSQVDADLEPLTAKRKRQCHLISPPTPLRQHLQDTHDTEPITSPTSHRRPAFAPQSPNDNASPQPLRALPPTAQRKKTEARAREEQLMNENAHRYEMNKGTPAAEVASSKSRSAANFASPHFGDISHNTRRSRTPFA